MLSSYCGLNAQSGSFSPTATNTTSTITNAGIDTLAITLSTGYNILTVDTKIVRASGTSAGTAILEWSVRGDAASYKADAGDTLTQTNAATQYLYWKKSGNASRFWRIRIGGATTVSATATAKVSASK